MPEPTSRRPIPGFIEFENARHPDGEGSWTVRIRRTFAERIAIDGPTWKYHALLDVPGVLFEPRCIFRGLEREGTEEFYCYVARPRRRKRQDGREEPTPPDRALFVFVSKRGTILKWRWERVDPDVPLEDSCRSRFGTLAWPKG